MIDRKTLWICWLLIAAMTAAGVWRLSLLPDWHQMPLNGPGDTHIINGLMIFWGPVALLLFLVFFFVRRWFVSTPKQSEQAWQRWSTLFLLATAAIVVLMQVFVTTRSLGFARGIDRLAVAQTAQVAVGLLVVLLGNAVPKMPRLAARFRPYQLDDWQWNQQVRFGGRLLVGLGLFMAIGVPLLPPHLKMPAMMGLWLAVFAANIWHRAKVKRSPSPPTF